MKEGEGMYKDKSRCPLCGDTLVAHPVTSLSTIQVECVSCPFKEKRVKIDDRLTPKKKTYIS